MCEKNGTVVVTWYVTDACNLRCKHCYHDEYGRGVDLSDKQKALDEKIIKEILKLSKTWNIDAVDFLGGEPLMHPDIFKYAQRLKDAINCKIGIGTNGTLIDENKIDEIKKLGVDKFQISLESSEAKIHDFYRGQGTFKKTIEAVKELVKSDVGPYLRMTVSNTNYDQMYDFVKLGKKLNVKCVSLNKYVPNNVEEDKLKALTPKQHTEFLHKIHSMQKEFGYDFVITEDPCMNNYNKEYIFKEFNEELEQKIPIGGCVAGIVNMIITRDGKIYPCTMLPIEIGDLNKESLVDIWENGNEVINKLRDRGNYLKGKCGECESNLICGGCRAAAYKMNGDVLAEDPFCLK